MKRRRGRPPRDDERHNTLAIAACACWTLMHGGVRHPGAMARTSLRGRPKKQTGLTLDEAAELVSDWVYDRMLALQREAEPELAELCTPERFARYRSLLAEQNQRARYVSASDVKRAYLATFGPRRTKATMLRAYGALRRHALARGQPDPDGLVTVPGSNVRQ